MFKRCFIFAVWPTIHTNPSRKRYFSKTLFKPAEIHIGRIFVVSKNILKRELLENVEVTTITSFLCPSDCCLFKFPRCDLDGKHHAFSECKTPFSNFSGAVWLHVVCVVPRKCNLRKEQLFSLKITQCTTMHLIQMLLTTENIQ